MDNVRQDIEGKSISQNTFSAASLSGDDWKSYGDIVNTPRAGASAQPHLPTVFMGPCDNFGVIAKSHFQEFDADANGFISKDEIDNAVTKGNFRGESAKVLVGLKTNYDALRVMSNDEWGFENDGITMKDLTVLYTQPGSTERSIRQRTDAQVADGSKDGGKLFPKGEQASVVPAAVNQGNAGDCYFLAPIASLASSAAGAEALRQMITDNKDGTLTVKFPGAENPVTIKAPTEAELSMYANGKGNGVWSAVLEKAFGEYTNQQRWVQSLATTVPVEAVGNGGHNENALKLLTGNDAETLEVSSDMEPARLHGELRYAFQHGCAVTTGIHSNDNKLGLPGGHAYSVLGYDASSRQVTIRNPWGTGEPLRNPDGVTDGVFKVSLKEFIENFNTLEVAPVRRK